MAREPLNSRQVEVLRWIADGCPDGVMAGFTYKTTAVALKSRRLVKVSKRGGWHAEVTEAGSHYLEFGAYPEDAPGSANPGGVATPRLRRVPTAGARTKATEARGSGANGDEVPEPVVEGESGNQHAAAPEQQRRWVIIPGDLRNPHPVVVALRDDKNRLGITVLARSRALRILQGLIVAAEHEGHAVREVHHTRNGYGYTQWDSNDHVVVETGEATVGIRILQQFDRTVHEPTARQLAEQKKPWGSSPPKYDHAPSDRLRIEIATTWEGGQHSWGDGKRGSVDAKLPAILDEIARRHEDAMQRRLKAEGEKAERDHQWGIVAERAKVALRESHRAEVLVAQVSAWQQANELRAYLAAMEAVVAAEPDPEKRGAGRQWFEWATQHAETLDPLGKPIAMPEEPEPTDEALAPFLPRRGLYGRGW